MALLELQRKELCMHAIMLFTALAMMGPWLQTPPASSPGADESFVQEVRNLKQSWQGMLLPAVLDHSATALEKAGFTVETSGERAKPYAIKTRIAAAGKGGAPLVLWASLKREPNEEQRDAAAVMVATMLRLKQDGAVKREVVLVLADARVVSAPGMMDVLQPGSGGTVLLMQGGWMQANASGALQYVGVQRDEKRKVSAKLVAYGKTGEPGQPPSAQATTRLAQALIRLNKNQFSPRVSLSSQALLKALARGADEPMAARLGVLAQGPGTPAFADALLMTESLPWLDSLLRTTCTVVALETAPPGSVPTRATASLDCRLAAPDEPGRIAWSLVDIVQDDRVVVERVKDEEPGAPSPADGPVMDTVAKAVGKRWSNAVTVPWISWQTTDAPTLRRHGFQTYGLPGEAAALAAGQPATTAWLLWKDGVDLMVQ